MPVVKIVRFFFFFLVTSAYGEQLCSRVCVCDRGAATVFDTGAGENKACS